jgi:hypothetical protein
MFDRLKLHDFFGVRYYRYQDPIALHEIPLVQVELTGPACNPLGLLQFPSTASSGRKLILVIFGGSYSFFP